MSEGALKAIRKINATCGVDEDDALALEKLISRVKQLIIGVSLLISGALMAIGKEFFGG
jgi:hypothetical protein